MDAPSCVNRTPSTVVKNTMLTANHSHTDVVAVSPLASPAEIAASPGYPVMIINVVAGNDSRNIGLVLTQHPQIGKLTFTGSTGVGKKLMEQCSAGVKKMSLELGGNAPFIVFADADIDADAGWHRTRGAGVVVAVIDSGVDISHPDLVNNIWHNPGETCGNDVDDDNNGYVDDCDGWDFVNNDNTPEDLNGHGTHVAGIIGAEANNAIGIAGVAYESQIMALKIGNEAPPLSAAIEAIAGYYPGAK